MALTKVKAGNILLTTPAASSNDVTPATTQYVTTALANMVDSAPSTLNTLNELAAALGDDANFSTTVTNSIAGKLPLAGGTMTGNIVMGDDTSIGIADDAERIEFDGAGDISVLGANFGVNSTSPATKFVVQHIDGESGIEFSMGASLNYIQSYDRNASDYVALKFDAEDLRFGTNNGTERMRIRSDGGVAIGTNNAGYSSQILSVKAASADTVFYGESTDANCIVSLRDNSSNVNVGYGATGNAHVFSQDGTEIARFSKGSTDKYSYNGGGIGGSGTNLHLAGDDCEIKMANNFIHSDNSGNTKFTIRTGYGATSSAAELSLDGGYISLNTGTSFTERMRINADGNVALGDGSNGGSLNIIGSGTQNATNDGKLYVEKNSNADWSIKAAAGADDYGIYTKGNGNYGLAVYNHNSSAYTFRVNYNGDILAVNTTVGSISDRRLKENIVDANSQWDDIKALKWKNYSWKESSGHNDGNTYLGLIADEVKAISPNLVAIEPQSKEDIEAGIANPEYENVKYSVVWLKAMKALQEAMAKIETLETKLEAAEARIATLEG